MFARWGVRGLHLNVEGWGGGSRISVLKRVWMNWDCLCSRGAAGSGEKSSVRSEETCETWGQRWGDSTSDLRCHISFICFWQTSHLILISPQQSLVLDFPYCVHLFFWDPARRVRYGTSHVLEKHIRRVFMLYTFILDAEHAEVGSLFNESVRGWICLESTHWLITGESTRAWRHGVVLVLRVWYLWGVIRDLGGNLDMWLMERKVSYFNNRLAEM